MKDEVISLHDGFPQDVGQGDSIPLEAVVWFEAVTLMKWERESSAR